MRALRGLCAAALVCALLCVHSAAASADGVAPVDAETFGTLVAASPDAWVLEFWSPRCGTCAEFAPLFADVASRAGSRARFGAVDIDTPAGMALAEQLDVLSEGVPNVRAFVREGDGVGESVFTGWEVPPLAQLERSVEAALERGKQLGGRVYKAP